MTAQIPDAFHFQNKKLSIVGVHGGSLFNPLDHDMLPLPRITSCWRGYAGTYKILHDRLVLDLLQVNLGNEGPAINNIPPVFSDKNLFDNTYDGLNLTTDFTGELLVAEGFLRELYVHMGFHPPWKYETVFQLKFSRGTVLDVKDVSQDMAKLRSKMMSRPPVRAESPPSHRDATQGRNGLQPGRDASREEVEKWIASTFRQDHGLFDENN